MKIQLTDIRNHILKPIECMTAETDDLNDKAHPSNEETSVTRFVTANGKVSGACMDAKQSGNGQINTRSTWASVVSWYWQEKVSSTGNKWAAYTSGFSRVRMYGCLWEDLGMAHPPILLQKYVKSRMSNTAHKPCMMTCQFGSENVLNVDYGTQPTNHVWWLINPMVCLTVHQCYVSTLYGPLSSTAIK